uniref:Bm12466 n=1 Tax=Brugia malayi TaxID=6279 RepID=A0A1U7F492_BRUMA|nr:Bm12466 [Brugia malayi]CRZ26335.1 Bm12467 [Brugia malayi]
MVAGEMYGLEWCRHRRIPTIHMARMIQRRELGGRKPELAAK